MEFLDLETSFEELKDLPIANFLALPINADIEQFKLKIEKKIKFPCWIKLSTFEHKKNIGALEKAFNFEQLKQHYAELNEKFPDRKFIIQENVEGFELLAGIKQDKTFGKVLAIGSGGSLVELIKDVSFRICPLEDKEILEMLKELKSFKLLEKYDLKSLVKILKQFSELEIKEADLNPIIVNKEEIKIVDARVGI